MSVDTDYVAAVDFILLTLPSSCNLYVRLFPSSRAIGENLTDVFGAPRHHISGYSNLYAVNLHDPLSTYVHSLHYGPLRREQHGAPSALP